MQLLVALLSALSSARPIGQASGRGVPVVAVVAAHGALQSNSSEVVRATLLDGMGIAYAPSWMASAELENGQVRSLLPQWSIAPLPINLVWPGHRQRAAKVIAFADMLSHCLGERTK